MRTFRPISRRALLHESATLAAALTTASAIPQWVHAASDDIIRLGLIGCGGRGCGAAKDALTASNSAKLLAVGDLFAPKAKAAQKMFTTSDPNRVDIPDARCFSGFDAYKKVIDAGVDLVILAAPPGFRPLHFEAAVQAGKHAFLEKAVAVDAPGARKVLAASNLAREKGLKVVVGYQRRHDPRYIESIKQLRDGAAGPITKLEAYWKAAGIWFRQRQPNMTEMEYQISNWMHFVWLSGDVVVETHTHNLDVCNWLMGTHPAKVTGTGGQQNAQPDREDTFDHFELEYTYPDGTPLTSVCGFIFPNAGRVGEFATGAGRQINIGGFARGAVARNPYVQEWIDLFTAITDNKPLNDAPAAAETALTAIMGRMAAYSGLEIRWENVIASGESFQPPRYDMQADPPAKPDANGRYRVPAKGRWDDFA